MGLVIGLGTGRCGTHSLAKLLDDQPDARVTHELGDRPVMPWRHDENLAQGAVLHFEGQQHDGLFGDVAFYWLNYAEDLLRAFPNAKFVVLKRDREETVESYCRWSPGRNHWADHMGLQWIECPWDWCFPSYPTSMEKEEAITRYWDEYYRETDRLAGLYPGNFCQLATRDLNSESQVTQLLKWLGVEKPNIEIGIKLATS
jgi:hypothetical protein